MDEEKFIWFNGLFVPWKEAKVHFLTHALHYGSGVFEGIRCYETGKGAAVFRLNDHLERFYYSASVFGMEIPFKQQELRQAIIDLVKKNGLMECYIRPLAFYGYGQMGLNPLGAKVDVGIAAWPWGAYLGADGIKNGVRLKISPWIRPPNNIMPTNAKVCGNYVNSIMAKVDALKTGFKDALLLDVNGNISEASAENVFIVKQGALVTPPAENALKGITRDSIIRIARDFGIEVEEKLFGKEQLLAADECFVTGTAAEVTPVAEVDGCKIGAGKPGLVTKKLQEKFYDAVKGRAAAYAKWLDFVE